MTRNVKKKAGTRRSLFDLSYSKLFDADMGLLYPVFLKGCIPEDIFKIQAEAVIRFQPMVTPVLHEVNAYIHYFFVPYRLLWPEGLDTETKRPNDGFEVFITGGHDGNQEPAIGRWSVSNNAVHSLWDHLEMPLGVNLPTADEPVNFPQKAYNLIYNEHYRCDFLLDPIDLESEVLQRGTWEKDYLQSCLPFQQLGDESTLPLTGLGFADFNTVSPVVIAAENSYVSVYDSIPGDDTLNVANPTASNNLKNALSTNVVDFEDITAIELTDLRLTIRTQRILERSMRVGSRYFEYIGAVFGSRNLDMRLNRPEYIGGAKAPVIFSEVLQTSESSTTAQGNMAGHGISVSRNFISKFHVPEHGLIMGILCVKPRTMYFQGLDYEWSKTTRFDYYDPEFANLTERAVLVKELYATSNQGNNNTVFGYQGMWNEMRASTDKICGQMRTILPYSAWHMGIEYATQPAWIVTGKPNTVLLLP